jgi:2-C-methyl-D-erythritol 4-phosphate cytidylyltransferase
MGLNAAAGSPPEVGVLLAAAGRGERAGQGEPKQFRPIGGVPMLLRAIRPFAQHPRVRQIVVALPAEFATRPPQWLAELQGPRLSLVAGGATRSASVAAALAALDPACSIVLVHDAARPFVSRETIDAVIAAAQTGVGAVAALPVGDTLKRVPPPGDRVLETVPRNDLWRAQTPQGFPRTVLAAAYARTAPAAEPATDDAQLVERLGHPVRVVPDRSTNLKVTTADDFLLAEALALR